MTRVMTLEQMRRRKRESGYTNAMIADESGVPLGTVQKVFSGATKAPRRATLEAITRVLAAQSPATEEAEKDTDTAQEETETELTGDGNAKTGPGRTEMNGKSVRKRYGGSQDTGSFGLLDRAGMAAESMAAYGSSATGRAEESRNKRSTKRDGEYTAEDYYILPDDRRVELIDGTIYDMASPGKLHQAILQGLFVQFDQCIDAHRGTCFLYIAPSDVELGEDGKTVVQPDLYIHCDREKEKNAPHHGAPDFVLEVLSPSNPQHDLWRKQELYRRHGVREYWLVDPAGKKALVFDFENDTLPTSFTFDDCVPVGISKGVCSIDFRKIYARTCHLYE